jgi:hypothetical protein
MSKTDKDPVRNPLVQTIVEEKFQKNYAKSLKVLKTDIIKILKNGK